MIPAIRGNPAAILLVHGGDQSQCQLTALWWDDGHGSIRARGFWDKPDLLAAELGISEDRMFESGSPEEACLETAKEAVRRLKYGAPPPETVTTREGRLRPFYHSWKWLAPGSREQECRHCGQRRDLAPEKNGATWWIEGEPVFKRWTDHIPVPCRRLRKKDP